MPSDTENARPDATSEHENLDGMPEGMNDLTDLSDEELLGGIDSMLSSERGSLARLVRYLGEVEERRLHLRQAYSAARVRAAR